jgi:hypothetical protein
MDDLQRRIPGALAMQNPPMMTKIKAGKIIPLRRLLI